MAFLSGVFYSYLLNKNWKLYSWPINASTSALFAISLGLTWYIYAIKTYLKAAVLEVGHKSL